MRQKYSSLLQVALYHSMNLGSVRPLDNRRIECLVKGLPLHSAQLAENIKLVCSVSGNGEPRPRAAYRNGEALRTARRDKERRYPELRQSSRCKLVMTALEVGGRWSAEAAAFLYDLASSRARIAPPALQGSAHRCWTKRWSALVSVAAQRTFADTFLYNTAKGSEVWEAALPLLGQVLGEEAHAVGPEASGLPLRC